MSNNQNENLPIYGVKSWNLSAFEKKESDLKKGITTKEPDYLMRLEDEDLVKMNLDEAIIGFSEDEFSDDQDLSWNKPQNLPPEETKQTYQ